MSISTRLCLLNARTLKNPNGCRISLVRRLSREYVAKGRGQEAIWTKNYEPPWWETEVGLPWKNPTQNPKDTMEMLNIKYAALKRHLIAEKRFPEDLVEEINLWDGGKYANLIFQNTLKMLHSSATMLFNEVSKAVEKAKYLDLEESNIQRQFDEIQQILTQTVNYLQKMKTDGTKQKDTADKILQTNPDSSNLKEKNRASTMPKPAGRAAGPLVKRKRQSPANDAATPVKQKCHYDSDMPLFMTTSCASSSNRTTSIARSESPSRTNTAQTGHLNDPAPPMKSCNPLSATSCINPNPETRPFNPVPARVCSNSVSTSGSINRVPILYTIKPVSATEFINVVPRTSPINRIPTTDPINQAPTKSSLNHLLAKGFINPVPTTDPMITVPKSGPINRKPITGPINPLPKAGAINPIPTTSTIKTAPTIGLISLVPTTGRKNNVLKTAPINLVQTTKQVNSASPVQLSKCLSLTDPIHRIQAAKSEKPEPSTSNATHASYDCQAALAFEDFTDFEQYLSSSFTNPRELQQILQEPCSYIDTSLFDEF